MNRVLMSYPKSGRTWLRIMLDQLDMHGKYTFHHGRLSPRFAHNRTIDPSCLKGNDVICLYRNPLDVVVSEFYASKYASTGMGWKGDIESYIKHQNSLHFRWILNHHRDLLKCPDVPTVSYENLLENGTDTLIKILEHWGQPVDVEKVQKVYAECVFEKLKNKTNDDFGKTKYFLGAEVSDLSNRENRKVREGKANNYHKHLSQEQIGYLKQIMRDVNYDDTLAQLKEREL